jgi:hypothetical protein
VTTPAPITSHDRELTIRVICRAVIHRVHDEHPLASGHELLLYLGQANPFAVADDIVQQIWFEEVLSAVSKDVNNTEVLRSLLEDRVTIH